MGMTMTQKILASAAGLEEVHAGDLIMANLDLVLANDITGPVSINEMDKFEKKGVFDKDKVALIPDHFSPNKDIASAQNCKCMREFARANDVTHFYEVGEMGIEHALLPGKRNCDRRRYSYRRRFPHMYLRRYRRFFHRCRQYRCGLRYCYG